MKKKFGTEKILSLIVAVLLAISVFPLMAFAESEASEVLPIDMGDSSIPQVLPDTVDGDSTPEVQGEIAEPEVQGEIAAPEVQGNSMLSPRMASARTINVDAHVDYFYMTNDTQAYAEEDIAEIEVDFGNGISILTSMTAGQTYSGSVSKAVEGNDTQLFADNPQIVEVFTLNVSSNFKSGKISFYQYSDVFMFMGLRLMPAVILEPTTKCLRIKTSIILPRPN